MSLPTHYLNERSLIEWEIPIVLLVAVDSEHVPILKELGRIARKNQGAVDDDSDASATIFYIPSGNVLQKIILLKCPHPYQGGDPAAWITTYAIGKFHPYCVIMVGICAGNSEKLEIGDVIISSKVYRHDYGKEENSGFTCRGSETIKRINNDLLKKLSHYASTEDIDAPEQDKFNGINVLLGPISSGCQVVKIDNAHQVIFNRLSIKSSAGQSHDRWLLGIDMESYSVAYSAENLGCIWLIIKGVSDSGSDDANIAHGAQSASINSLKVALVVIREIILKMAIGNMNQENEANAVHQFEYGNISEARNIAGDLFNIGRRSIITRRRFLHGLIETDRFKEAEEVIRQLKRTEVLYDANTAEYEAQLYSRKGCYDEVIKLSELFKSDNPTVQLLYLGSTASFHHADRLPRNNTKYKKYISDSIEYIDLAIEKANNSDDSPYQWIYVFKYFLIRVLKEDNGEDVYQTAVESLNKAIQQRPELASGWFHALMFYCIANNRNEFDNMLEASRTHGQIISWSRLDSAAERLNALVSYNVIDPSEKSYYWSHLCEWVANRAPRNLRRTS